MPSKERLLINIIVGLDIRAWSSDAVPLVYTLTFHGIYVVA